MQNDDHAEIAPAKWYAIDEVGSDNFATSIYEDGDKGLLVARCNQNGQYPWQAQAIIRGMQANKALHSPSPAAMGDEQELIGRLLSYADAAEADGAQRTADDLREACSCMIGWKSANSKLKAARPSQPESVSLQDVVRVICEYNGGKCDCPPDGQCCSEDSKIGRALLSKFDVRRK